MDQTRTNKIQDNLGLVHHVVKRYLNRGVGKEDLFQIGCIGLIKAVDRFDETMKVCFSTYAVPMIEGEIRRFLRDDGMVRVSRSIKENRYKIECFKRQHIAIYGKEPTVSDMERETGLSVDDILLANNSDIEWSDIDEHPVGSMKSEAEGIVDHLLLMQLLNSLSESERQLIILRYFKDKTQAQVAECMDMSQVQVSRMEKKILVQLRRLGT